MSGQAKKINALGNQTPAISLANRIREIQQRQVLLPVLSERLEEDIYATIRAVDVSEMISATGSLPTLYDAMNRVASAGIDEMDDSEAAEALDGSRQDMLDVLGALSRIVIAGTVEPQLVATPQQVTDPDVQVHIGLIPQPDIAAISQGIMDLSGMKSDSGVATSLARFPDKRQTATADDVNGAGTELST